MTEVTYIQGNSFSLSVPLLKREVAKENDTTTITTEPFIPASGDVVTVKLIGERRQYTYTPTMSDNVAVVELSGNELSGRYAIEVTILTANGGRMRYAQPMALALVPYTGTVDSIVVGSATLDASIFFAMRGAKGEKGDKGDDGNGIANIAKTSTSGLVDTYTITYTNGATSTFEVTNGKDGAQGTQGVGVRSITQTSTSTESEGVNVITITLTDGSTSTFEVRNGARGAQGDKGDSGVHLGDVKLVNNLTEGGEESALTAEMGKELGVRTTMRKQMPCYAICTKGYYYNSQGVLAASNSYMYAFISLENVTHLNVAGASSTKVWYFGSDGTIPLGNTTTADVDASSFPSGSVYAGISYATSATNTLTIDYAMPAVTNEVENGDYKYKKLTYPIGNWTLTYNTGEQSYNTGWYGVLGFIPLMGADFIFCAQNDATRGVICFYDENFVYISGLNYCRAAKVPSTAKYAKIRCNNTNAGVAEVYLFEGADNLLDHIVHLERDVTLLKPMPMKGKTVAFLGDSITASNVYGLYVKLFAERSGATTENFAIAGQTYANGQIAAQANNLVGNEDVVVMMAGTNDFGQSVPIGATYNESGGTIIPTTDATSICGGVHSAIQAIYAKCPTAKIIIITPPQKGAGWTANTQGKYLYEYADAIKKVAQLYGVLVIDQFANCNINPVFSAMKTKYFNSDGTHPNNLYHQLLADWLYNAIADWIREPFL